MKDLEIAAIAMALSMGARRSELERIMRYLSNREVPDSAHALYDQMEIAIIEVRREMRNEALQD